MNAITQKMPFYDWIDTINNANSTISQFNTHTNPTYRGALKQEYKDMVYRNTYNRLMNILMKMFKWTIPEDSTLNPRAIELGFIKRGQICIFKDDLGIWSLPCCPTDKYNVYGEPLAVNVYGFNGYQKTIELGKRIENKDGIIDLKEPAAVYCRDNELAYPYEMYLREYAAKITDCILALGVATNRLKTPFMYEVNDINLKDDVKKMVDMIENNDDIIVRVKQDKLKADTDTIKPYNISIDANSVMALKELINFNFNMFLETIGINTNPSPDKSQVVLTSEINSNNILIDLEKDIRLELRERMCEDVKKVLGIDISVVATTDEMMQEIQAQQEALMGNNQFNEDKEGADDNRQQTE